MRKIPNFDGFGESIPTFLHGQRWNLARGSGSIHVKFYRCNISTLRGEKPLSKRNIPVGKTLLGLYNICIFMWRLVRRMFGLDYAVDYRSERMNGLMKICSRRTAAASLVKSAIILYWWRWWWLMIGDDDDDDDDEINTIRTTYYRPTVLLYGSETWTLLKADERRLEAFHMNCQRRSGSTSEDDPAERGCSRSKTTLGSTPTTTGGSHMTASLGGRYDPWPVKPSTDWLTDWLTTY